MKRFLLVLLSIFFLFSLSADNLFIEKLDNGLTVIMNVVPTSSVTAIRAFVKTGSMYEDSLLGCGISHYFEHIMAGGTTQKRTEADYDSLKQAWGAWYNAYTTIDHTAYYFVVPSQYSYEAARALSEWIVYPAFDSMEVAREKGVIQKEILMGDTPDERIWDDFMDKFIQNHPIKYPVIGFLPLFNSIKRSNIISYYTTRYTPDNTVVVVAGNFNPDSMRVLLKDCYKEYKRRPVFIPHIPDLPYQSIHKEFSNYYDINKFEYYRAYHVPALNHPDIIILKTLADYLDSKDGELYDIIVNQKGWAKNYSAFVYTSQVGGGGFYFYIDTDKKAYIDSVKNYIDKYINKIKEKGIPKDFLVNYARSSKLSYQRSIAKMENRVSMYGIGYIRYNDPLYYNNYYKRLESLSPQDFAKVANKYLNYDNSTEYTALPIKEKGTDKINLDDKYTIKTNKKVLKNGAVLLYRIDDSDDLVNVEMILKNGGSAYDSIPGESYLLAKMLEKGSKKYNEMYLSKFFKGSDLNIKAGTAYLSVSFTVLRKDLDKSMAIINDVLLHPLMSKKDFNRIKENTIFDLKNLKDDNERYSFNEFAKEIFKGTPYYNRYAKSVNSIEKINLDRIKRKWSDILNTNNIIVGIYDIDNENVALNMTEKLLKGIKDSKIKSLSVDKKRDSFPSGEKTFTYKHPQVNIYISYPAPSMDDSMYVAYRTLMAFFNGNANLLHKALRVKNNLVYYAYGYMYTNLYDGATGLFIAQTSYEKKDTVLSIMKSTIDNIIEGNFTDEDLELVKTESLNKLSVWYQTKREQLDRDMYYEFLGLGYDFLDTYKKKLQSITRKDIDNVIKTYFKDKPFIFVALPEEVK